MTGNAAMDELALDIFRTDDFRATTMTDMIGDVDYVPTELMDRGWFIRKPIRTETVTFIKKDKTLELVPTSERGTPENLPSRQVRGALQIETPRLAMRDRITAREVANLLSPVLPFQIRLDNANDLVTERQGDLIDRINLTKEAHMFGALQGKVLDADGVSIVADYFDLFDIPEPAEIGLNIAATPVGQLRAKLEALITRPMRRALKGRWTTGTRVHAFVGDDFWNALINHDEVRQTYLNTAAAAQLRDPTAWGTFTFAGITFENWYGEDYEELEIAPTKARFFPVGARDTFFEFLAPGEDWEEVGALGRELYSVVSPDNRINMNEWVDVYVRSYPLYAMKAPQALMKARVGA